MRESKKLIGKGRVYFLGKLICKYLNVIFKKEIFQFEFYIDQNFLIVRIIGYQLVCVMIMFYFLIFCYMYYFKL